MNLPELSTDDLARLRLQECQGTLIGGMKVACGLGINAEQFGFRMMMEQGINWARLCGDLDRIARIFYEHYQVTYGFGAALRVSVDADSVRFDMSALESAAAGQLAHWQMPAAALHDLNRGFWRALTENAGITATLEFKADGHTVTVRRG
ncbi:MAG: hypothetical protein AB7N69_01670 [Immundisolibacter sp.]|uniref:hypothetical protein n=1 Tax=Immundisolibacter sp. TaxID=1934948 RepID=UPI003D096F91